jgi:hypothetical protein
MEDQTALTWHTSSYSGNGGNTCVEIGTGLAGEVAIRDTTRREDGMHVVTSKAFAALRAGVKSGRFNI